MGKLSVALITPWKVRCGIATYSEHLANALAKQGVDIYIIRLPRFGTKTPGLLQNVVDKIPVGKVDIIHCFPATTKVLTPIGAKHISEVKVGDTVFTHLGRFGKVTRIFNRHFTGSLVKLKAQYSQEITVTPEHPFLAVKCGWKGKRGVHIERFFREGRRNPPKLAWIKAKDLNLGDFIAFPRITDTYDVDTIRLETRGLRSQFYGQNALYVWSHAGGKERAIPKHIKVTPEFCRLLGYYVAEGNYHPPQLRFSFNKKEKEYCEDVEELMEATFNLEASMYEQGDGICLTFTSRPVAELFGSLCGVSARNKRFPNWSLTLPINKQKQLLKGLWHGDGSLVRDGFSLTTYSEALMEQLRLLFARLGIAAGIYPKSHVVKVCGSGIKAMEKILGVKHPWQSKWGFRDFAHVEDDYIYYRLRRISRVQFKGQVYNIEVSPDNSYLIPGYSVHNCQHEYGLYQNLEAGFYAALKRLGKPVVTTMHSAGNWGVDPVIADASDRVVVHNKFCARRFGYPEKTVIIGHGCSPTKCPPAEECKKALGIDPRAPLVGYVGFISTYKGLETLIEAMKEIRNAALLIGGGWHTGSDTQYIAELKQRSLEALPGRCQWIGYVPSERLATVYGSMSIVVYPSRYISESGALLMALSHGKAVIASRLPPVVEKEKVGALMTFRDLKDLRRKIRQLLKDEELRRSLEKGARDYAESVSWPRVALKHLSLYHDILK